MRDELTAAIVFVAISLLALQAWFAAPAFTIPETVGSAVLWYAVDPIRYYAGELGK